MRYLACGLGKARDSKAIMSFYLAEKIIVLSIVVAMFVFCFWQEADEKKREKLKKNKGLFKGGRGVSRARATRTTRERV